MPISLSEFNQRETLSRTNYDAIVIGSGVSGLTCAIFLAEAGKKVLILESHGKVGGLCHTFKRKDVVFDVGLHYLGEVLRPKSMFKSLMTHLLGEDFKWHSLGEIFDTIKVQDKVYPYHKGEENFIQQMCLKFPASQDQEAIKWYVKEMKAISRSLNWYFIDKALPEWVGRVFGKLFAKKYYYYSQFTTSEYLDLKVTNPELKTVLTGQWGDYGLPPEQSSVFIHAAVFKHYLEGAAYPEGGSLKMISSLQNRFANLNGEIVLRAKVENVISQQAFLPGVKKAVGVELKSGERIYAPKVISSIGVKNSIKIAPAIESQFASTLHQIPVGCGHLCLYMVCDQDLKKLNLPTSNYWVYSDFKMGAADGDLAKMIELSFEDLEKMPEEEMSFPLLYFSFTQNKDPSDLKPNGSMEVITFAPFKWFEKFSQTQKGARGDQYNQFKDKLKRCLERQIIKEFPSLEGHISFSELSTPLSTKHYCNYDSGEIYGLSFTKQRFLDRRLRPQTPMKNFFLTGQDIGVAGVAGAALAGVLSASVVLKRNILSKLPHY